MRAIAMTGAGGVEVLRMVERPLPEPGPSQIRVRVCASALNRADILQRRGAYPSPPGVPRDIPGLEYAGEVDAVGSAAGLWSAGNRVMGIIGGGAHAEFVCVHEREAIRVPQHLTWEQAAAVPEAFLTAYDALINQLDLQVGERVLIHAVGSGVGTAALQLARSAGAITFGTSRSERKLVRAGELGLHHAIDSSRPGWAAMIATTTGAEGVDAIVDLVGAVFFADNLRILSDRGKMIVVGTVGGASADLDLRLLLQKRLRILGTVLRSRPLEEKIALARDFSRQVVPMFASGLLRPVIDTIHRFDDIAAAHRQMEANDSFGKIVLVW